MALLSDFSWCWSWHGETVKGGFPWCRSWHREKGDGTFSMMPILTQRKRWHVFHDADLNTEKKELARWEKGDDTFSMMLVLTQRKARWHVFHEADINTEKKEMARRWFWRCWCCSRWTKRKGTAKRRREINEFLPRFEVGTAVARVWSFHGWAICETMLQWAYITLPLLHRATRSLQKSLALWC